MGTRFLAALGAITGAIAVASLTSISTAGQAPASAANTTASPAAKGSVKTWTPPRTPWGDPDIEGLWPGTDFVGVPLQRPDGLGTRNELTDAEFAVRLANFQKQTDRAVHETDDHSRQKRLRISRQLLRRKFPRFPL